MKSFAIISFLASAVYAQSSGSSNPLIPSGISSGCTAYLNKLDTDQSILACSSALVKATSAFGAGSGSTSADSTKVNSALSAISSATSSCPQSLLRSSLTAFYAACQPELTTSPNDAVIRAYDVLYSLYPLTQAVCSKSDNGNYCVLELGNSSSVSGSSSSSGSTSTPSTDLTNIQKYLWTPASSGSAGSNGEDSFYPNVTTFRNSNILFLLLQPTLSSSSLCVSCTRSILSAYISFESDIPYAPGLAKSPFMSGQTQLYLAVQNTCGATFLSGAVQAAGGLSGGIMKGAAVNVAANYNAIGIALATFVFGFYVIL